MDTTGDITFLLVPGDGSVLEGEVMSTDNDNREVLGVREVSEKTPESLEFERS